MFAAPTYRSQRVRYQIDHCRPQRNAIQSGKIDFHALTKGHYPGIPVPRKVLPGLNNIGFWDAGQVQDWGVGAHRNEGIEIMFLETGTMSFSVDQKNYRLRAGQFTITRPWQLHKLGQPNIGPGRVHWLILDVGIRRPHQPWRWPKWVVLTAEDLAELTRKLRRNENPVWQTTPAMADSFRELARDVVGWGRPHCVSRLAANLNQLLIGIFEALDQQQACENKNLASPQRTVELFLQDLETGRLKAGDPWTLDKMVAYCGLGVTTLCKYCRELVNAGPMEYLNHCRLDQAARQLKTEPKRLITEIALENGFNSSQYFATLFRRRFHQPPRAFREH